MLLEFLVTFLDVFSYLYKRVCPFVRPSVRHTRVEFLRKGLSLNYAICKMILSQVQELFARKHLLSVLCQTNFHITMK